ncbi:MAG: outer membrane protein assembly factor BamB family protein, partial [Planctomycetota bacterium]
MTAAGAHAVLVFLLGVTASGEEGTVSWNQFRGPNGQGVSLTDRIPVRFGPDSNCLWKTPILPVRFGPDSNCLWKTPIPFGQSSPVIWGDRIFFTARDRKDRKKLTTLCIDRGSGEILWRQPTLAKTKGRFHSMNGPATSTPAVDRDHLYVYFPTWGLVCYDHEGKSVWKRKLETPRNQFRGPNGQGSFGTDSVPVRFGPDSNCLWKTPIPFGQSSPVIWGDRIFFTARDR